MKDYLSTGFLILFLFSFSNCAESQIRDGNHKFSKEEVHTYFKEVALGSEFGNSEAVVKKWQEDIKIYVSGEESDFLRENLDRMMKEINELVSPSIKLTRVNKASDANFEIFYGTANEYVKKEPKVKRLVSGNFGLFYVYSNAQKELYRGTMYIDISRVKAKDTQRHILLEELTQALGLMNDSYEYKRSIFFQKWTLTQDYANIDRELIRLLYHPKIKPGMSPEQVDRVLQAL